MDHMLEHEHNFIAFPDLCSSECWILFCLNLESATPQYLQKDPFTTNILNQIIKCLNQIISENKPYNLRLCTFM